VDNVFCFIFVSELKQTIMDLKLVIKENQNTSDVSDGEKYWFNDRKKWETERNKLDVSDDDVNWSKDDNDKLISFWYGDRNEGWIKR
jgi:hypothetical protein